MCIEFVSLVCIVEVYYNNYVVHFVYICMCTMQMSGMCGTSRWKAAKASSKKMKNLDETGLIVSGCRHSIAQKAINMFRGEI